MLCGLGALGLGAVTVVVASPAGASASARASIPPLSVVTSARVAFDVTVTLPAHYVATLRGTGLIDFAHEKATVSITLAPGRLHSNQRTRQPVSPLYSEVSTKPIQLTAELIGGSAYVSLPPSVASLIGGAPLATYPMTASLSSDLTTSLTQTSVAITYAHLLVDTLVGQHTRGAGSQTMGGVRVSGAAVNLTVAELLKIVPAIGPVMGPALDPLTSLSIPVTIWTDSRGRMIQATFTKPKSAKSGLSGTVRFSAFNAPVSITPPAAGSAPPMSKQEVDFLEAQNPFADSR
jgi:hypothetical protein